MKREIRKVPKWGNKGAVRMDASRQHQCGGRGAPSHSSPRVNTSSVSAILSLIYISQPSAENQCINAVGLLPVLVINTVVPVALLKNILRSLLQLVGAACAYSTDPDDDDQCSVARRRVSITQYKFMTDSAMADCCVCLCAFQGSEEVSELSGEHFFHTACLDKWFLNRHTTCPLCRSAS
ncbi:probable E3 ubiquitin-protein ligase XERICO [Prosopis cineraria]|uniref:probable E3 ubiquitin-protein ligase XERICO n=1 Tax=Prosopis cineraria TaxID=364024 RepID=UPI00240EBBAC|nr:probable E3 ubiquitin-protein ligase XERICO [Prosopis cineraria]